MLGLHFWMALSAGEWRKVDVFHNSCPRKICNIYWPNKITNEELYNKTEGMNMWLCPSKLRNKYAQWEVPKVALRWTPTGKRKRGRRKYNWRITVMKELEELVLTWREEAGQKTTDENSDERGWRCWFYVKRPAQKTTGENSDERAGGVGSSMAWSAGQSSGRGREVTFSCCLMSQPEWRGWVSAWLDINSFVRGKKATGRELKLLKLRGKLTPVLLNNCIRKL